MTKKVASARDDAPTIGGIGGLGAPESFDEATANPILKNKAKLSALLNTRQPPIKEGDVPPDRFSAYRDEPKKAHKTLYTSLFELDVPVGDGFGINGPD